MEERIRHIELNVGKEFADLLGGRYISQGDNSGEEFYNDHLLPKYEEALNKDVNLIIIMDDAKAYPSSFVDESFGMLGRRFNVNDVKTRLVFETSKFKTAVNFINSIWEKTIASNEKNK